MTRWVNLGKKLLCIGQYYVVTFDCLNSISQREGFSRFNKIYEFDYRLRNQQVTMTMTSVSGHLLGLEFIGTFKSW